MKPSASAVPSILLVDDDVELLTALTKVLKKAGYEVVAQPDALSAIRHVSAGGKPFDLVISDVCMPGMPGTALLARLKTARPTVPVILISAHCDRGQQADALRAGVFEYLYKPLDKAELLTVVRRALTRPVSESPAPRPGQSP